MSFFFPSRARVDAYARLVTFSIQGNGRGGQSRAQFLIGRDVMSEMGWSIGDRVEVGYGEPDTPDYGRAQVRRGKGLGERDGYRVRAPKPGKKSGAFQASYLPEWIRLVPHDASRCQWTRAGEDDAIIVLLPAWAVKEAAGDRTAATIERRSGAARGPRPSEASGMGEDCESHARETGVTRGGGSPAPVEPQTEGRMSGEAPAASDADPKQAGESPAPIEAESRAQTSVPLADVPQPQQDVPAPIRDLVHAETAAPHSVSQRGEPRAVGHYDPSPETEVAEGPRDPAIGPATENANGRRDSSSQTAAPSMRGGAVEARQAHNLEVAGSIPAPATNSAPTVAAGAAPSLAAAGRPRIVEDKDGDGLIDGVYVTRSQMAAYVALAPIAFAGGETPKLRDLARSMGANSDGHANSALISLAAKGLIKAFGSGEAKYYTIVATGKSTRPRPPASPGRASVGVSVPPPRPLPDGPSHSAQNAGTPTKTCKHVLCGKLFPKPPNMSHADWAGTDFCTRECSVAARKGPSGPRETVAIESVVGYLRQSDRASVLRVGSNYFIGNDGPLTPQDLVEIANKRRLGQRLSIFELAS